MKPRIPTDLEMIVARGMVNSALLILNVQRSVELSPRQKLELGNKIENLTTIFANQLAIARSNGVSKQRQQRA